MSDVKITAVMMDDSTIDVKKEVDMVFSIANTLRGPYKPDKYKDVIGIGKSIFQPVFEPSAS